MKTIVVFLLMACACVSNAQPTNAFITFTNSAGTVLTNARVVKVEPDGLIYMAPDGIGGGKVKFSTLPEPIQKQFNYDPAKAVKAETDKRIADAKYAAQSAQETQSVMRNRRMFAKKEWLKQAPSMTIHIIQKLTNGYLASFTYSAIQPNDTTVTVLLEDVPYAAVDGDRFSAQVWETRQEFTYTTVQGSEKTVRKYTCNMDRAARIAIAAEDAANGQPATPVTVPAGATAHKRL
jgi:hypothetical protein